jgi:N-glycosylase/DNA lyase
MRLPSTLKKELQAEYALHGEAIRLRLEEFRAVPEERWFYEMCYCLLTPQSSARQCALVCEELERLRFRDADFDPTALLRSHHGGYVRFHNTKAQRLRAARTQWLDTLARIHGDLPDRHLRNTLAETVAGLGYKEASHFLRNIGRGKLAIVDRHIIRNLIRLGVLPDWPKSISRRRYMEIEALFEDLARSVAIPMDELDLLLWRRETGFLLK